jgi:hypothetical protein
VTRDFRHLVGLLEQPVLACPRPPEKPVYHIAVRNRADDRPLSDAEWAVVAEELMHRTGVAPRGDDAGCRWVAVRHAEDHVHIVATLVRQDGAPAFPRNDFYRIGEACRQLEERLGLAVTASRDRTAATRPTYAEAAKAQRRKQPVPARDILRTEVQAAAAAADGVEEFFAGLQRQGVMVRQRLSVRDPGEVTGYAVAWPGDVAADGSPIWYGGGRLAADLTLPKLKTRWGVEPTGDRQATTTRGPAAAHGDGGAERPRLSAEERDRMWRVAAEAADQAAAHVRSLAGTDPDAASDAAAGAADALTAAARVAEGSRGGPITDAARAYDRASRELYGRPPVRTSQGSALRHAARALSLAGRATPSEREQLLALIVALAGLAEAVAQQRAMQDRLAQATAARDTAVRLRHVAPTRPGAVAAATIATRVRPAPAPARRRPPNHRPGPRR